MRNSLCPWTSTGSPARAGTSKGAPSYVWAVNDIPDSPQAIVKTDEEGRFALWYPAGKPLRIFIDDESYSRTTYECWITSCGLKADVEINPRVGDLEVWGLHAWRTQLNWHVYFWPCSLPLDLRAKRSGRGREFAAPRLRKEEITVRIDGEEVPVLKLHQVKVPFGDEPAHAAYLIRSPIAEKGALSLRAHIGPGRGAHGHPRPRRGLVYRVRRIAMNAE